MARNADVVIHPRDRLVSTTVPTHPAPGGVVESPFAVTFRHRLRYTDDVLGRDRAALVEVLEPSGDAAAKVQFFVDGHVAQARPEVVPGLARVVAEGLGRCTMAGEVRVVPGGEAIKNDRDELDRILGAFNEANLDRRSYVVVVGGGAVLDAVGFAAAVAHRGIRLVRLPTTTLAQADSGVGVKNAVNFFGKKNWLGAFAVPWAVINDTALLETLPDRDFIAGFSEAVKVSLLKSPAAFDQICRTAARIRRRDLSVALPIIRASVEMHLGHITQGGDPFEAREARPLDFGHWSAHKLEPMSGYALRHGEAVAIGVAIDAVYSALAFGLLRRDAACILRCLTDLGFVLNHPALDAVDPLLDGLEEFRQHLGGRLTVTMLRGVGDPIDVHEVDPDLMREAIGYVSRYGAKARRAALHADAERPRPISPARVNGRAR